MIPDTSTANPDPTPSDLPAGWFRIAKSPTAPALGPIIPIAQPVEPGPLRAADLLYLRDLIYEPQRPEQPARSEVIRRVIEDVGGGAFTVRDTKRDSTEPARRVMTLRQDDDGIHFVSMDPGGWPQAGADLLYPKVLRQDATWRTVMSLTGSNEKTGMSAQLTETRENVVRGLRPCVVANMRTIAIIIDATILIKLDATGGLLSAATVRTTMLPEFLRPLIEAARIRLPGPAKQPTTSASAQPTTDPAATHAATPPQEF